MGSGPISVGRVGGPASARTTSNAKYVGCATPLSTANTTSSRVNAGNAMEPRFASTTSNAAIALNAKTSHAPFKGAYSLAIALAVQKNY